MNAKVRTGRALAIAERIICIVIIDSFVSFSYLPIRFVAVLGLVFSVASFIVAMTLVFGWREPVRAWVVVTTLFAFVSGIQMMMIGLIGEYLWRTLDASRKRLQYVVDKVYAA